MPSKSSRSDPDEELSRSGRKDKKRKTRKRAVLQFRIPEANYRELAKTAVQSDLTISELAASRLLAYPLLEQDADADGKILNQLVQVANAAEELEKRGYRTVVLRLAPSEINICILTSAQLEELLIKTAKLAAERVLKDLVRAPSQTAKPQSEGR